MRAPSLGQVLVTLGGGLALWASTCFFAPPPPWNPTRQGERLELVPGARWEFDLGGWDEALGLATLSLRSELEELAQVDVRVERDGYEPLLLSRELHEEVYLVGSNLPPGPIALEIIAYAGPAAWGRAYVWNNAQERGLGWSLMRSGGMFGLLAAALLVGLGLLLIWRRSKPAGAGAVR